jgi:hypothetical protein
MISILIGEIAEQHIGDRPGKVATFFNYISMHKSGALKQALGLLFPAPQFYVMR